MNDESGSAEVVRTLAGGVLLGVIAAGVMGAWAWASDRPECSGEMFACVGEVILVALIGIPAALTLAWLGLRALGTSNPALAVAATFLAALVFPSVIDPPLWVWPVGVGAVGCGMIALLGAGARPTT
jgi:hypothetical protein